MSSSTALKRLLYGILTPVLFCMLIVQSAEAQATFGVANSTSILNNLGYTELLAPVTFFVQSGTTQAGTIEFFVPNVIFTDTSGVALVTGGGLSGATIGTVVPNAGIVDINVPAGAGPGSSVTLSGLRVSAVGATFTKLNAAISISGNFIVAGQNSVQVVQNITSGVIITNSANSTLTVANNVIVASPGTYVIAEAFPGSFSSAVGVAGQTNKTQVVFQVTGLPDGLSLTFPSPITSDSGTSATLVAVGGGPAVLTNQSSSNQVIYEYNASVLSANTLDQFSITPTIDITGTVGSGNALIQVAMGPIGAAVPNAQYPSTAIPRYAESFTPPSPTGPPAPVIVSNLSFPVPSGLDSDTVSISNVDSGTADITASARAADGTLASGVSNPVTFNLSGKQTTSVSLKDLFGSSASPTSIAAVELSASNHIVGNSIGTVGSNRFGIASPVPSSTTYIPFDLQTSADILSLTLKNTNDSDISVQIVLNSSLGATLNTAARTIKSHGVLRESLATLFSAGSIPLSGYISITGPSAFGAVLVSNHGSQPEEIPSLPPTNSSTSFPFFAFGSGYNSVLTMINSSTSLSAKISLNAYTATGSALVAQPIVRTLAPGERQNFDFGSIFGTSASSGQVSVGYFTVTSQSATNTLFGASPTVYGMVRVSVNSLTTDVPLFNDSGTLFYMTPTTETANAYTGLAFVNTSSADVSLTLEVTSATGTSIGTKTFTLVQNSGTIQLLRELIPQSLSHDNGILRISATGPVKVLGFRGTLNLSELIFLRGETTTP